jgi:hypothetical protein
MQGAPKQQANAEELLAELKRALESSTRAPNAPPPPRRRRPSPVPPARRPGHRRLSGKAIVPLGERRQLGRTAD